MKFLRRLPLHFFPVIHNYCHLDSGIKADLNHIKSLPIFGLGLVVTLLILLSLYITGTHTLFNWSMRTSTVSQDFSNLLVAISASSSCISQSVFQLLDKKGVGTYSSEGRKEKKCRLCSGSSSIRAAWAVMLEWRDVLGMQMATWRISATYTFLGTSPRI